MKDTKEIDLIVTEEHWNAIYDDIYKLLKKYSIEGTTDEQIKQLMNGIKSIFTEPPPDQQNLN